MILRSMSSKPSSLIRRYSEAFRISFNYRNSFFFLLSSTNWAFKSSNQLWKAAISVASFSITSFEENEIVLKDDERLIWDEIVYIEKNGKY